MAHEEPHLARQSQPLDRSVECTNRDNEWAKEMAQEVIHAQEADSLSCGQPHSAMTEGNTFFSTAPPT